MKEYKPLEFEEEIYKWWEESGWFKASDKSEKPPYCIVIPPPNVTGVLHMGHALTNVIQDTFIRWRRMQGYNTLWLPGTDHAGIATQAVVERKLRREGTTRHNLGRKEFVKKVWEWKEQYGETITGQLRRLGSSLDWERERFTLDEGLSKAVVEVFVKLHEEGLIYKANRLINWCPSCRTALSNLEVEHEPHDGFFWYINYPLIKSDNQPGDKFVTVATTRPETMLGDTAVAVHPHPEKFLLEKLKKAEKELSSSSDGEKDEKQKAVDQINNRLQPDNLDHLKWLSSLIGTKLILPLTGRTIPVVGDYHADPSKGTGAVKITPGHDFNDFEVGKRNDLETINILNTDGTLNDNVPEKYRSLTVIKARKLVIEDLENQEYLKKVNPHDHEVGHCSRCSEIVEPLLSLQWFVDAKPLALEAVKAIREKETEIIPPMWEKVYFHWLDNIQDWCISRQLWWGHQIPAWYCEHGHITVARDTPQSCTECGSTNLKRDEDVLDTWFSSALWPFSTLGWPEKTDTLNTFYPNAIMETGFDILFFWVARMMMMGIHFMGEVPFKKIFLHAMVRDSEGRKMSKSLGNTIDPLDVIYGISKNDLIKKIETALPPGTEKAAKKSRILNNIRKKYPQGIEVHGADALRFTLAIMAAQGRDVKLDLSRIGGYRAFANKVWQALQGVVIPNSPEKVSTFDPSKYNLKLPERWILSRLGKTVEAVNNSLEEFRMNEAADAIYKFFWHEYCDWYLEFSKPDLYGNNGEEAKAATCAVLNYVADIALHLLHPFMPFLTEKLWQELPKPENSTPSLMISPFPNEKDFPLNKDDEDAMELLIQAITAVRAIRGENSVPTGAWVEIKAITTEQNTRDILLTNKEYLVSSLTRASSFEFIQNRPPISAASPIKGGELFIPLEGIVDFHAEIIRLNKVLVKYEKDLQRVQKKLNNPGFVAKAPPQIIQENERRVKENSEKVEKINNSLKHFQEIVGK
jgi:valyl-tRNA synthetase